MGHVVIFMYLVTLLVGAWAAFAFRQALTRDRVPLLRSLVRYIVLFNVAIFTYLVIKYVFTNLLAEDVSSSHPVVLVVLCLAGFCVEIGVAFALVQVSAAIRARQVAVITVRAFQVAIGVLGASFIVGTTLAVRGGEVRWLLMTYGATATAATAVIIASLVVLTLGRHRELDPARRRAARGLGALFLSGWLAYVAGVPVPEPAGPILGSVALLWLNIVPLVWLRVGVPRFRDEQRPASALDAIASEHNLTVREREVVELILQGKSNKEIEELLFISSNTVKNHIYNTYRKLDVKSRTQLMSLVMVAQVSNHVGEPEESGHRSR